MAFIRQSQAEAMGMARKEKRESSDPMFADVEQHEKRLEMMRKQLRIQRLCMKIAVSVKRGDRVPPEDLAFLAKNDPEGYKLAMAMRKPKRNPEKCDSVLKDEDKKSEPFGDSREATTSSESEVPSEGGMEDGAVSGGSFDGAVSNAGVV